jgi:PAS domain S-box-containing protein
LIPSGGEPADEAAARVKHAPARLRPVAIAYVVLMAAVVGVAVPLGLATLSALHTESNRLRPAQTQLNRLFTDAVDQETGARGYVITANPTFLEPYDQGRTDGAQAAATLTHLVAHTSLAASVATELRALSDWQQQAGAEVATVQAGRQSQAAALVAEGKSKAEFDALRASTTNLAAAIDAQDAVARHRLTTLTIALLIVLAAGLVVAVIVGVLARRWVRGWTAALRRSEERFRALVMASTPIVWSADETGMIVDDSPGWRAATGQTVEEYLGRGWRDAVHPDDLESALAFGQEARESGTATEVAFRLRMADGTYRRMMSRAIPLRRDGRVVEWVGATTDVEDFLAATSSTHRLLDVTAALSSALSGADVSSTLIQHVSKALGAYAGTLAIETAGELQVIETVGFDATVGSYWQGRTLTEDSPLLDCVIRQTTVTVASPDEFLARYPSFAGKLGTSSKAWVATPFIAVGVSGAIGLSFAEPHRFTPDELLYLEGAAAQAAQAMERARLFDAEQAARAEVQAARDRLALLNDVSVAVSAGLSPSEVVERLTRVLVDRFADLVVVYVPEGSLLRRLSSAALFGMLDDDEVLLSLDSPAPGAVAFRTGQAQITQVSPALADAMGIAHPFATGRDTPQVHSKVTVPLVARGAVIGSLGLGAAGDRVFTTDDVPLVTGIAVRAAMAIDNATRYTVDREIATVLQRAMLPNRLPAIPGLWLDAAFRPASSEVDVGGDWYDVIPIDDTRVVVALGDAMGKGLSAAVIMSELRSALRAFAVLDPEPLTVLGRLDDFARREHAHAMVTLAYALIDLPTGTTTIAHAGHPPVLHIRADHSAAYVDGGRSTPIGLGYRDVRRPATVTARLAPGDTLVLYSDGLIEDRRRDVDVGLAALLAAAETVPRPPSHLCEMLIKLLHPSADDDTALLAVSIT